VSDQVLKLDDRTYEMLTETHKMALGLHTVLVGVNGSGGLKQQVDQLQDRQVEIRQRLEVLIQERAGRVSWRAQIIASVAGAAAAGSLVLALIK